MKEIDSRRNSNMEAEKLEEQPTDLIDIIILSRGRGTWANWQLLIWNMIDSISTITWPRKLTATQHLNLGKGFRCLFSARVRSSLCSCYLLCLFPRMTKKIAPAKLTLFATRKGKAESTILYQSNPPLSLLSSSLMLQAKAPGIFQSQKRNISWQNCS